MPVTGAGAGDGAASGTQSVWTTFDGVQESTGPTPASVAHRGDRAVASESWAYTSMDLHAVVSQITATEDGADSTSTNKYNVLHLWQAEASAVDAKGATNAPGWYSFNDFLVRPVAADEVIRFESWRHPCLLFFRITNPSTSPPPSKPALSPAEAGSAEITEITEIADVVQKGALGSSVLIPESVFDLPSISAVPCARPRQLPASGELVAFDAEVKNSALLIELFNHHFTLRNMCVLFYALFLVCGRPS